MTKKKPAPTAELAAASTDSEIADAIERINAADTVVDSLTRQLAEAKAVMTRLTDERKQLALSALGDGDVAAQERLDELHHEVAEAVSRTGALEEALSAARERVAAAEAAQVAAVKRRDARRVLAGVDRVRKLVEPLDDHARRYFGTLVETFDAIAELARLGPGHPTMVQVRVMAGRAILTHAMESRRVLELPMLSPGERISFRELTDTWLTSVKHWADERLAEVDAPVGVTR